MKIFDFFADPSQKNGTFASLQLAQMIELAPLKRRGGFAPLSADAKIQRNKGTEVQRDGGDFRRRNLCDVMGKIYPEWCGSSIGRERVEEGARECGRRENGGWKVEGGRQRTDDRKQGVADRVEGVADRVQDKPQAAQLRHVLDERQATSRGSRGQEAEKTKDTDTRLKRRKQESEVRTQKQENYRLNPKRHFSGLRLARIG